MDNKKVFLIILIGALVIYLDFSFFLNSQFRNIKSKGQEIIKLKKDLDDVAKNLKNMQDLKNKLNATNQKMPSKVKKIISEEQIAGMLEEISSEANKNDVKIVQIKPSKESPIKQEKAAGAVKFKLLLINLDLFCGYHNLGRFINNLENAQIFIAVQDIKISAQREDYLKQKVNLVLRTYVRK